MKNLHVCGMALFALVLFACSPAPSGAKRDAGASESPTPCPAASATSRQVDAWWVAMHEQFNARARQAAENGDIALIFLGDSITFQWSGPGRSVWDEFYANRHAVNLGIGGDRTQHLLWRIQHGNLDGLATPAKGSPPKLVILMIGTNNSADDSVQDIAHGIRADVAMIREKLPATKVLLLAVFPRGERPNALRERVATASELVRPIADGTMVFYLDIGREFVEVDGTIRKEIMPDFIHLSAEGYRRWAVAIEPMVRQLMGESTK